MWVHSRYQDASVWMFLGVLLGPQRETIKDETAHYQAVAAGQDLIPGLFWAYVLD